MFLKVNVAICHNTARGHGVNTTPTFLFFRNREKVHQVTHPLTHIYGIGTPVLYIIQVKHADAAAVEAAIIQHLGSLGEGETPTSLEVPGQVR